ncbi:MAG: rod shape-determining protein [Archaeoglobaceae archaeon]
MGKGIDVGTMNIICAEKEGDSTVFAQERNAFLEIDASDLTKNMLDSTNVLYIEKGDKFHILGDDAFKFANVFKRNVRRPMKYGIISPEEKESIPMIKLIIEKVLSNPSKHNEVACISSPANPVDSDINVLYHKKTIEALAKRLGYETHVIDEGLAVIYSELAKQSFTGIGVSIGAGLTNVTVAYMATPIVSFSIARGGDWIDEQVAIATGMTKERITSIKEKSFALDTEFELGSVEGALSIYYDALITYIIQNLRSRLAEVTPPDAEFPIAVAGGSARPKGFIDMFEKRLVEAKLSVDVSNIKKAKEPIYNVARGCLIAALTKEGDQHESSSSKEEFSTQSPSSSPPAEESYQG